MSLLMSSQAINSYFFEYFNSLSHLDYLVYSGVQKMYVNLRIKIEWMTQSEVFSSQQWFLSLEIILEVELGSVTLGWDLPSQVRSSHLEFLGSGRLQDSNSGSSVMFSLLNI